MELYIRSGGIPPFYICERANKTFEQWAATGVVDFYSTIPLMIYGIPIVIIYLLAFCVFFQKDVVNNPFYRIMMWISLCDMITVGSMTIVTGILSMHGAVYCMYPNLIYLIGAVVQAGWGGSCIGVFFLVISRLADIVNKELYQKLFGGKRSFVIVFICFLYWCLFYFYTPPVIYNSAMRTWMFDPLIFTDRRDAVHYASSIAQFNNFVLNSTSLLIYIVFAVIFIKKYEVLANKKNKSHIVVFVQSTIVSVDHVSTGFFWIMMDWIPPTPFVTTVANTLYLMSGGSSAIMYVTFNKTIRSKIFHLLGISKAGSKHVDVSLSQATSSRNKITAIKI